MKATPAHDPSTPAERLALSRLTAEERAVRDAVRAVIAAEIAPRARAVDADGIFPHAGIQALAAVGLGGLLMPIELGGAGTSALAYAIAMEEIAAACGSTSTVYMTQMHAAHPIELAGTPNQQRRWIPGLCRAQYYGSLAISEPDAGSDVASLRCTARRDGDSYVINGTKTFITTGDRADVIVLFASVAPSEGRRGITAFLVERGTPGLACGRVLSKLGLRGSSTTELFLHECRIPASARLGDECTGYALAMRSVVNSRLSAAAQGVGYARAAYEEAAGWARRRGLLEPRRVGAQDVQFALAELRTRTAAARSLLYDVARLIDDGGSAPTTEVSMAKLFCTDAGLEVALGAMDVMGLEGDLAEFAVERIARDAKVAQIYDGTNQIQRLLIARGIAHGRADA